MNRHCCDRPCDYQEKGGTMPDSNSSTREWDCTRVEVGFCMYKKVPGMNGSQGWIIT